MSIEYVAWQDDDKGWPVMNKMRDAMENYRRKKGQAANVVAVHPETAKALGEVEGVDIREARYIGRNVFYVGREER